MAPRNTTWHWVSVARRRLSAFLVVNGAAEGQLEVVSFGEEFPVDYGHDEGAWSKTVVVLEYK